MRLRLRCSRDLAVLVELMPAALSQIGQPRMAAGCAARNAARSACQASSHWRADALPPGAMAGLGLAAERVRRAGGVRGVQEHVAAGVGAGLDGSRDSIE